MRLTPTDRDRLLIFTAAELARSRRARGLQLNVPEATALIADTVCEAARDGPASDGRRGRRLQRAPARRRAAGRGSDGPGGEGGGGLRRRHASGGGPQPFGPPAWRMQHRVPCEPAHDEVPAATASTATSRSPTPPTCRSASRRTSTSSRSTRGCRSTERPRTVSAWRYRPARPSGSTRTPRPPSPWPDRRRAGRHRVRRAGRRPTRRPRRQGGGTRQARATGYLDTGAQA